VPGQTDKPGHTGMAVAALQNQPFPLATSTPPTNDRPLGCTLPWQVKTTVIFTRKARIYAISLLIPEEFSMPVTQVTASS